MWSFFTFLDKILVKSTTIFKRQWDERINYDPIKVREHQWLIILIKDRKQSLIPQFYRTYVVNCDNGVFTFSCMYSELNGFACRHFFEGYDIMLRLHTPLIKIFWLLIGRNIIYAL